MTQQVKKEYHKPVKYDGMAVQGKMPPQAVELEEAIIGAALLQPDAAVTMVGLMEERYFYKDDHQQIFAAIKHLVDDLKPVDILTVMDQLKKNGTLDLVGGPFYITKLTSRVSSSSNLEYHCAIVVQKYMSREHIRIGSMITVESYDEGSDPFQVQNKFLQEIEQIQTKNFKQSKDLLTLYTETVQRISSMEKKEDGITGVNTGYEKLNNLFHGFQPEFIILAARPSVGKTTLVINMILNGMKYTPPPVGWTKGDKDYRKPVGFFSIEMSEQMLVEKIIVIETGIDPDQLKVGNLTGDDWDQIIKQNFDQPLFIDDTAELSITSLQFKARLMVKKHGVKMIVVDYLQLMSDSAETREQEISKISRGLKKLQKELNIPIIALCQLSRELEKTNRKPRLSDLRESGSLEQDADVVMFIHNKDQQDQTVTEPEIEIIIAKHRNGKTGQMLMTFVKNQQKFYSK